MPLILCLGKRTNSRFHSMRNRDLVIYVGIAITVVMAMASFAIHQARTGAAPDLPLKWLGLIGLTAILFGYAIRNNRKNWSQPRFWGLVALLASVHFLLWIFLLIRIPVVPILLLGLST